MDPKGSIKSIAVLEAIRFLGSTHKHDVGPVWNVVPAPSVGHGGERRLLRVQDRVKEGKRGKLSESDFERSALYKSLGRQGKLT